MFWYSVDRDFSRFFAHPGHFARSDAVLMEAAGEIELYNDWFGRADVDRDNRLSGAEAVAFFGKSGLDKQTLFKVWQGVAGDRPYLSRQEFYTAMKLVAVAQGQGGVLEDGLMARVVNGLGGRVGVPRMAGLNDGDSAPVAARSSAAGTTNGAHAQQVEFPMMTAERARMYQTAFEQLDTGNRRMVSGTACFGTFMQSGLSKGALKDIWDVVAGQSAELNGHQFIQCMYLIDWVKARGPGAVVPKALPAQFPPGDALALGGGGEQGGGGWGLGPAAELHRQMPDKAVFVGGVVNSSGAEHASAAAYTVSPQFASLSAQEQANLAEQERLARQQEERLAHAEQQRKEIAARQQFYTSALADLRISQSKSSRGLVEAEQRLEMERKACEEMEAQYEAAYAAFNEEHARVGPVLKTLEEVETEKASLVAKKAALESAVKNLEDYNPEWEARERGECDLLRIEIAELVSTHAALEKHTEAMKRRQESISGVIGGLKAKIEAEKGEVDALKASVDGLDAEKRKDGEVLVGLLQQVVPMYTRLYAAARDALVPLPNEVILGSGVIGGKTEGKGAQHAFAYDPAKFGVYDCFADWQVFREDASFRIATAIPVDDRLEVFTSPSVRAIEEERMEEAEEAEEAEKAEKSAVVVEDEEEVVVKEEAPEERNGDEDGQADVLVREDEAAAGKAKMQKVEDAIVAEVATGAPQATQATQATHATSKIDNPVFHAADDIIDIDGKR